MMYRSKARKSGKTSQSGMWSQGRNQRSKSAKGMRKSSHGMSGASGICANTKMSEYRVATIGAVFNVGYWAHKHTTRGKLAS